MVKGIHMTTPLFYILKRIFSYKSLRESNLICKDIFLTTIQVTKNKVLSLLQFQGKVPGV